MNTSLITIAYTDANGAAVEKDIRALGYTAARLHKHRNAGNSFTLTKPGATPGALTDIAFESNVAIYKDRTGAAGNYQQGTRIFYGRRTHRRSHADAKNTGDTLTFEDAILYDLPRIFFQHYWMVWNAATKRFQPVYFSRINLFQSIDTSVQVVAPGTWAYFTADQQLAQIIQYAATQQVAGSNVRLQVGKLDPVWNMPLFPVKGIKCLEALQICVRSIPDAVMWLDYTTNDAQGNPLPTFNVTQRPNCTPHTLPWSSKDAAGRSHVSTDIIERPDLIPQQVVFQYQQTNSITVGQVTQEETSIINDAWPVGSQGNARRAIVVPIDLRGATKNTVLGSITSQAFNPASVDFWKAKKTDLANPNIINLTIVDAAINAGDDANGEHPNGVYVTDDDDNFVDLTFYKYEYVDGAKMDWMTDKNSVPIQVIEVNVEATVSYTVNDQRTISPTALTGTRKDKVVDTHTVTTRIKLTNSIPNPAGGPTQYSTVGSFSSPEVPSPGFAQNIFNSLQPLQYELTYVHVEDNVSTVLGPEYVLNLAGPGAQAAWANMNAVIESVSIDFFTGETTIDCGPFKHLTEKEFFDLHMMWASRVVYDNPGVRASGVDNSASGTQMPSSTPKEDTNASSTPPLTFHSVADQPDANGLQFAISHDVTKPAGPIIFAGTVKADGSEHPDDVSIKIDLSALPGSELVNGVPTVPKFSIVRVSGFKADCVTPIHSWFIKTQDFDGA